MTPVAPHLVLELRPSERITGELGVSQLCNYKQANCAGMTAAVVETNLLYIDNRGDILIPSCVAAFSTHEVDFM